MSSWLVVFAKHSSNEALDWFIYNENGKQISQGQSIIEDLVEIKHEKLLLIIPGQNVTAFRHHLSGKNDRQIQAIAPYVVEDDIALDVDEQHISVGFPDSTKSEFSVCSVDKNYLEFWLNSFSQYGLAVDKCLPDYFTIPRVEDGVNVLELDDRTVVRVSDWGASFDREVSEEVKHETVQAAVKRWKLLHHLDNIPYVELAKERQTTLETLACSGITEPFSLLQGTYSKKAGSNSSALEYFKVPFVVGLVVMILVSCFNIYEAFLFKSQTSYYDQQVTAEIKRVFPNVKRVVNPRAQLKSLLSVSEQTSDFLRLSGLLSAGINEIEGVSVDSLRYDNRRREIQASVVYDDYAQISELKRTIELLGGVLIEGGSRQLDNRRTGEITVAL